MFSQRWIGALRSSGMWRRVIERMVSEVFKESSAKGQGDHEE